MEIILAFLGVGILALLARRKSETVSTPVNDGQKNDGSTAAGDAPLPPVVPIENAPDAAESWKADNARELAAIEEIEAMLGEESTQVLETVFVRADGSGPGSVANPATTPAKGVYYRVQEGDNPIALMRRVGYPDAYWRKLAAANVWCQKRSGGTLVGMQFYKRWEPNGFNTVLRSVQSPDLVFPIIYIPRPEEMASL